MALRRDEPRRDGVGRADRTERVERVEHYHEPGVAGTTPATNVNVGASAAANDAVVIVTRVVMLVFTVLEALLLFRSAFKLAGANASQPLVSWLYAFTESLVRPYQGIFPEPRVGIVVDVPALLSIVFLFLVSWLIVALVRAVAGKTV